MNSLKSFSLVALLAITTHARAENTSTVLDATDRMALVSIDGDAAEVTFNLIKHGTSMAPAGRRPRSEKVVGANITCVKDGQVYSCQTVVLRGGVLSAVTEFHPNPAFTGGN